MDNPFQSPVILSLCPGILGLERGLERAIGAFSVAAYVEIEAFCVANLVAAMEAGVLAPAPVWTNLKTFDARPFRGKVHGIIGGYPCQPFSIAGDRKGQEDPRHLWPYIRRTIKAAKPVWCLFENVRGHLSLGFEQVYRELAAMGYAVECGIYSAAEAGAPHERERLFILAVANSYREQWRVSKRKQGQKRGVQGQSIDLERRGEEIPHPECCRCAPGYERMGRQTGANIDRRCEGAELGYANGGNELHLPGRFGEKPTQKPITGYSGDLPNPECRCTQLSDERGQPGQQKPCITGGSGQAKRWPAPPGEPQYDWEEPRTTEPGMGCTINGYDFTEDLLRAYGNSVVEQSAEIAMIDLLNKHFPI